MDIHTREIIYAKPPPIVFHGVMHGLTEDAIKELKVKGYLPIRINGMRDSAPPYVVFPEPASPCTTECNYPG